MARTKKKQESKSSANSNQSQHSKNKNNQLPPLQTRLALNRFFCRMLGAEDFRFLQNKLHDQREGWAEDGHSYFFRVLEGLSGLGVPRDKLADYDLRIKGYVERLNHHRIPPVQLKYFQYLAVLFTEIYLDRYFTGRGQLVADLNEFLKNTGWDKPDQFTEDDLTKLAFWMATGSGKTLIMHINMWQFLHYARYDRGVSRFTNVLLITPYEGLSRQHLEELRKSGIPARHYGGNGAMGGLLLENDTPVTVIEITKLTKSKRGGGLSVEVDAFGSNNLLFVDEGHRGASGETWRTLRRRLAEQGFTFEYSATFGQIVNGASKDKRADLLNEYSKAILFDYSYSHFYQDGYGKGYFILNVEDNTDTFNEWMMLGNLLSFYEQNRVYAENLELFRPYNIEMPLWVFVGHSVTGGNSQDDKASLTDVQEIVRFFADFLNDRTKWSNRISEMLEGKTGLKNKQEEDVFKDLFPYLKNKSLSPTNLYDDIVRRVFHANPGEMLRAVELKAATGEIGLRAGVDNPYFGVINIGDVPGLMKLLDEQDIPCEDENINDSLFERINDPVSTVNILIGSRKFMEGWDSFRVASMGLMNIGKGEGSQVIQLFGRGVRLRGKNQSLKRSSALEADNAPPHIRLLETLNVFGVRANYMAKFREYLKQEGVEPDFEEIAVPVRVQDAFLKRELKVLRLLEGDNFLDSDGAVLSLDTNLKVTLDLRPRLEMAKTGTNEGKENEESLEKTGGENNAPILKRFVQLMNWERIYFKLVEFKRVKGLHNLSFTQATLREIIEQGNYELWCPDEYLVLNNFSDLRRVEEMAAGVLRKYAAAYYERQRRAWVGIEPTLNRLQSGGFTVKLRRLKHDVYGKGGWTRTNILGFGVPYSTN